MILAPHPDDEALAVGGLLQRAQRMGDEVHLLFVTDGEDNPWAQRVTERRWRISRADQERWRMRRRGEALASLACLGVPKSRATFLAFPDQGLTEVLMRGGGDLLPLLRQTMERLHPTLLVVPHACDLHPDHSALALIAGLARAGMNPGIPRPLVLHFVVHAPRPRPLAEVALRLDDEERRRKRAAILCHGSQLMCRRRSLLAFGDEPEEFIMSAPHVRTRAVHPVRAAAVEEGGLVFHLSPRARIGAWGPTELLLLIVGEGAPRGFRVRVPMRSGGAEILPWNDSDVIARARVERRRGAALVVVPASLTTGSHGVFVKLERRHGFFDEAGWWGFMPLAADEAPVCSAQRLRRPMATAI